MLTINEANYGRTDAEVCSEGRSASELRKVDCRSSSALTVIRDACDGKASCSVSVDKNTLNSGSDPCQGTFKYAEVKYSCTGTYLQFVDFSSHSPLDCENMSKYDLQGR